MSSRWMSVGNGSCSGLIRLTLGLLLVLPSVGLPAQLMMGSLCYSKSHRVFFRPSGCKKRETQLDAAWVNGFMGLGVPGHPVLRVLKECLARLDLRVRMDRLDYLDRLGQLDLQVLLGRLGVLELQELLDLKVLLVDLRDLQEIPVR
jgi:hypothetical protein